MREALFCLLLLPSAVAQKTAPPPPAPASAPALPPVVEPIPLTQIAMRGEELSRVLRDISRRLPEASALEEMEEQLAGQEETVQASLEETGDTLAGSASIMELRELSRQWRGLRSPEAQRRKMLREWGAACEDGMRLLEEQRVVWEATLKSTKGAEGMEAVADRTRQALKEIQDVKDTAQERLASVVDLQGRVSKQAVTISDTLEKLGSATQRFSRQLLYPEAYPIWRVSDRRASGESMEALLSRSVAHSYSGAASFLRTRQGLIGVAVLALALLFVGAYRSSRGTLRARGATPENLQVARVLRRPVALALLTAAPFVLTSLPLARMSFVLLLMLFFLVPIVRLLPLFVGSGARLVYFFSAFYALSGVVGIIDLDPPAKRNVTAALFAAVILVLAWWGRPARVRPDWKPRPAAGRERLIIRLACAAMAPVLLTNVLGFLLLSHLLRLTILLCSYIGLILYTAVCVAAALLAALLQSPRMQALATVRLYRAEVLKWSRRALAAGAVCCWIYAALDLFELKAGVSKAAAAVLNSKLGIKALSISLGDVVGLVGVLAVGYLASRAIRFILREELLYRMRLARGIPEVISTLFYYVLLLVVLFMSLSAAGVQLDKLTVLTGAFGVGIGFGLQNVVNNFVSGLIIQFERPIRVGDVLEVGTLNGEIRHIGIRASTLRTFQGAEVIIPNSTFVSNQVVNWTLSEARRRVEVPVQVAYGTAPETVIGILIGVASSFPDVLPEPPPAAFLLNFGPNGLEFLLMFWADQTTHFRLRSEVTIGVNAALREAGIEIPYPHQDIRVRAMEPSSLRRAAG